MVDKQHHPVVSETPDTPHVDHVRSRIVSEALIVAAVDLHASLHKSFYIFLLLSGIILYSLFDEIYENENFISITYYENELSSTEAALRVVDMIYKDNLLGSYLKFLKQFADFESAVRIAGLSVDEDDPRWSDLDRQKLEIHRYGVSFRSVMNIKNLHARIEPYIGDDIKKLPVYDIKEYSKWLIYPEEGFDNHNAIRTLEAHLYVMRELGLDERIGGSLNFPDSFYFHDFVKDRNSELYQQIQALRDNYDYAKIVYGINRLKQFCEDRNAPYCNKKSIDVLFENETNPLIDDQEQKISAGYFPVSVKKPIIIGAAPIVLFVVFFQFFGHERRWRRFVQSPSVVSECGPQRNIFWAITDAIRPQLFVQDSFSVRLYNYAMFVLVNLALIVPLVAQVVILAYGLDHWATGWIGLVCVCVMLSLVCWAGLIRSSWWVQQGEVEGVDE